MNPFSLLSPEHQLHLWHVASYMIIFLYHLLLDSWAAPYANFLLGLLTCLFVAPRVPPTLVGIVPVLVTLLLATSFWDFVPGCGPSEVGDDVAYLARAVSWLPVAITVRWLTTGLIRGPQTSRSDHTIFATRHRGRRTPRTNGYTRQHDIRRKNATILRQARSNRALRTALDDSRRSLLARDTTIADQTRRLNDLQWFLDAGNRAIGERDTTITTRDATISNQDDTIRKKDEELADLKTLRAANTSLTSSNRYLNTQLTTRDCREIRGLQTERDSLQRQIRGFEPERTANEAWIKTLGEVREARDKEIERLKKQLQDQSAKYSKLEGQDAEKQATIAQILRDQDKVLRRLSVVENRPDIRSVGTSMVSDTPPGPASPPPPPPLPPRPSTEPDAGKQKDKKPPSTKDKGKGKAKGKGKGKAKKDDDDDDDQDNRPDAGAGAIARNDSPPFLASSSEELASVRARYLPERTPSPVNVRRPSRRSLASASALTLAGQRPLPPARETTTEPAVRPTPAAPAITTTPTPAPRGTSAAVLQPVLASTPCITPTANPTPTDSAASQFSAARARAARPSPATPTPIRRISTGGISKNKPYSSRRPSQAKRSGEASGDTESPLQEAAPVPTNPETPVARPEDVPLPTPGSEDLAERTERDVSTTVPAPAALPEAQSSIQQPPEHTAPIQPPTFELRPRLQTTAEPAPTSESTEVIEEALPNIPAEPRATPTTATLPDSQPDIEGLVQRLRATIDTGGQHLMDGINPMFDTSLIGRGTRSTTSDQQADTQPETITREVNMGIEAREPSTSPMEEDEAQVQDEEMTIDSGEPWRPDMGEPRQQNPLPNPDIDMDQPDEDGEVEMGDAPEAPQQDPFQGGGFNVSSFPGQVSQWPGSTVQQPSERPSAPPSGHGFQMQWPGSTVQQQQPEQPPVTPSGQGLQVQWPSSTAQQPSERPSAPPSGHGFQMQWPGSTVQQQQPEQPAVTPSGQALQVQWPSSTAQRQPEQPPVTPAGQALQVQWPTSTAQQPSECPPAPPSGQGFQMQWPAPTAQRQPEQSPTTPSGPIFPQFAPSQVNHEQLERNFLAPPPSRPIPYIPQGETEPELPPPRGEFSQPTAQGPTQIEYQFQPQDTQQQQPTQPELESSTQQAVTQQPEDPHTPLQQAEASPEYEVSPPPPVEEAAPTPQTTGAAIDQLFAEVNHEQRLSYYRSNTDAIQDDSDEEQPEDEPEEQPGAGEPEEEECEYDPPPEYVSPVRPSARGRSNRPSALDISDGPAPPPAPEQQESPYYNLPSQPAQQSPFGRGERMPGTEPQNTIDADLAQRMGVLDAFNQNANAEQQVQQPAPSPQVAPQMYDNGAEEPSMEQIRAYDTILGRALRHLRGRAARDLDDDPGWAAFQFNQASLWAMLTDQQQADFRYMTGRPIDEVVIGLPQPAEDQPSTEDFLRFIYLAFAGFPDHAVAPRPWYQHDHARQWSRTNDPHNLLSFLNGSGQEDATPPTDHSALWVVLYFGTPLDDEDSQAQTGDGSGVDDIPIDPALQPPEEDSNMMDTTGSENTGAPAGGSQASPAYTPGQACFGTSSQPQPSALTPGPVGFSTNTRSQFQTPSPIATQQPVGYQPSGSPTKTPSPTLLRFLKTHNKVNDPHTRVVKSPPPPSRLNLQVSPAASSKGSSQSGMDTDDAPLPTSNPSTTAATQASTTVASAPQSREMSMSDAPSASSNPVINAAQDSTTVATATEGQGMTMDDAPSALSNSDTSTSSQDSPTVAAALHDQTVTGDPPFRMSGRRLSLSTWNRRYQRLEDAELKKKDVNRNDEDSIHCAQRRALLNLIDDDVLPPEGWFVEEFGMSEEMTMHWARDEEQKREREEQQLQANARGDSEPLTGDRVDLDTWLILLAKESELELITEDQKDENAEERADRRGVLRLVQGQQLPPEGWFGGRFNLPEETVHQWAREEEEENERQQQAADARAKQDAAKKQAVASLASKSGQQTPSATFSGVFQGTDDPGPTGELMTPQKLAALMKKQEEQKNQERQTSKDDDDPKREADKATMAARRIKPMKKRQGGAASQPPTSASATFQWTPQPLEPSATSGILGYHPATIEEHNQNQRARQEQRDRLRRFQEGQRRMSREEIAKLSQEADEEEEEDIYSANVARLPDQSHANASIIDVLATGFGQKETGGDTEMKAPTTFSSKKGTDEDAEMKAPTMSSSKKEQDEDTEMKDSAKSDKSRTAAYKNMFGTPKSTKVTAPPKPLALPTPLAFPTPLALPKPSSASPASPMTPLSRVSPSLAGPASPAMGTPTRGPIMLSIAQQNRINRANIKAQQEADRNSGEPSLETQRKEEAARQRREELELERQRQRKAIIEANKFPLPDDFDEDDMEE